MDTRVVRNERTVTGTCVLVCLRDGDFFYTAYTDIDAVTDINARTPFIDYCVAANVFFWLLTVSRVITLVLFGFI